MERVKQVQTKLGFDDARQTLGSIRVRQGSDLVGCQPASPAASLPPVCLQPVADRLSEPTEVKNCIDLNENVVTVVFKMTTLQSS